MEARKFVEIDCPPVAYEAISSDPSFTDLYTHGVTVRGALQMNPGDWKIVSGTPKNIAFVEEAGELGLLDSARVLFTSEALRCTDPEAYQRPLTELWRHGCINDRWVVSPYMVTRSFEAMVKRVTGGDLKIIGNAAETERLLNNKGILYPGFNFVNEMYRPKRNLPLLVTKGYVVENKPDLLGAAIERMLLTYPAGVAVKANLSGNGEGIYPRIQCPNQSFHRITSAQVIIEKSMISSSGEGPVAMSAQVSGSSRVLTPAFQVVDSHGHYRGCSSSPVCVDPADADLWYVITHKKFSDVIVRAVRNLARTVRLIGNGSVDILVSRDVRTLVRSIDSLSTKQLFRVLQKNELVTTDDPNWPRKTGDIVCGRKFVEENKLRGNIQYRMGFLNARKGISLTELHQAVSSVDAAGVEVKITAFAPQTTYASVAVSGKDQARVDQVFKEIECMSK